MIEYIVYDGNSYPACWVDMPDFGERLVSVHSLDDALMPGGKYVSMHAREIDEEIFGYVPDCMIDSAQEDLEEWVKTNLI